MARAVDRPLVWVRYHWHDFAERQGLNLVPPEGLRMRIIRFVHKQESKAGFAAGQIYTLTEEEALLLTRVPDEETPDEPDYGSSSEASSYSENDKDDGIEELCGVDIS